MPITAIKGDVFSTDLLRQRIHQGATYDAVVSDAALVDTADIEMVLRTVGRPCYLTFLSAVDGACTISLFETPIIDVDGTPLVPVNRRRTGTPGVATTLLFTGPTLTGDGTQLYSTVQPALFDMSSMQKEWVLAADEDYLIRLTNDSGSAAAVSLNLSFYEL